MNVQITVRHVVTKKSMKTKIQSKMKQTDPG